MPVRTPDALSVKVLSFLEDIRIDRDKVTNASPRLKNRLMYEALAPYLGLRYYARLVYARMHTSLQAFPDMMQKWKEHADKPMLPVERQALFEAVQELSTVIHERMAKGEEMTTQQRLDALTLSGVIEDQLWIEISKLKETEQRKQAA